MCLERHSQLAGDTIEGVLQRGVGERLHLAAVVADEVVVVLTPGLRWLVAGDPVAELDPLHELECGERVENPVHTGDPGTSAFGVDAVVDLLRRLAALLASEMTDDAPPRSAAPKPGAAQAGECMLDPGLCVAPHGSR